MDTEGKDLAPAQPTPSFHLWTPDSQDLFLHSEQSVFACSFPLLVLQLLSEERIIYMSTDCCSVIYFGVFSLTFHWNELLSVYVSCHLFPCTRLADKH